MKIVVLDFDTVSAGDIDSSELTALGDVTYYGFTEDIDVASRIGDADVALCTKSFFSDEIFEKCKNLRYVGIFATGFNNIDIESAARHNVIVTNVPEYSTNAVAQHAFALMLHHFSKVSEWAKSVENGDWINSTLFTYFDIPITEMACLTLGIIGFGSIGKKVSEIALAFGMKVVVFTRTIPENYSNVEFVSLDELLKISDVVTIHCPLTHQTKHLICKDTLSKMKRTALLINTSRGGIVNETDLAFALNNEVISAAGLDVVDVEPMLENNPLRNAKNCFITPHVAWSPINTRERLVKMIIDNINAWRDGTPQNVVN